MYTPTCQVCAAGDRLTTVADYSTSSYPACPAAESGHAATATPPCPHPQQLTPVAPRARSSGNRWEGRCRRKRWGGAHLADERLRRWALAVDEEVSGVGPLVQDDIVPVLVAHDLLCERLGHAVPHLCLGQRFSEVAGCVATSDRLAAGARAASSLLRTALWQAQNRGLIRVGHTLVHTVWRRPVLERCPERCHLVGAPLPNRLVRTYVTVASAAKAMQRAVRSMLCCAGIPGDGPADGLADGESDTRMMG